MNKIEREMLLEKVDEAMRTTHEFEVGDRAIITSVKGHDLSLFDVVTITYKISDSLYRVISRNEYGRERRGVVHPMAIEKLKSYGKDFHGKEIFQYDYVEGIDEFDGELMLVNGIDDEGNATGHPVKIRLEPDIERHINRQFYVGNVKKTTLEEWLRPKLGDIVTVKTVGGDVYGTLTYDEEECDGVLYGGVQHGLDHEEYALEDLKTVLRK